LPCFSSGFLKAFVFGPDGLDTCSQFGGFFGLQGLLEFCQLLLEIPTLTVKGIRLPKQSRLSGGELALRFESEF
jgi:hypothetical protein